LGAAAPAAARAGARPLPPPGGAGLGCGEGIARAGLARSRDRRLGLLRDGRLVRLRGRQVRRLDEGGRAPAPAARPRGPWQHADRRRRLLLPRPDRDGGPAGAAPVASAAAGSAAAAERSARVAPGRAAPAPAAAGAGGGGSGPDRAGLVAEDRMTARSM